MLIKLITLLAVAGILFLCARFAVIQLSARPVAQGVQIHNGQSGLAACPDTPNCATDRLTSDDPAALFLQLHTLVDEEPAASLVTQSPDYLHAIWKTRLMGYIDDVEFWLDPDQNQIQVRSASRLGKSDLGANRMRIESIRQRLTVAR